MDDVKKYANLIRSKSSGMLAFRRTVPKELRSIVGKSEIKHAFGTDTLSDVLTEYQRLRDETNAVFEAARKKLRRRTDGPIGVKCVTTPADSIDIDPGTKDLCEQMYANCVVAERAFQEGIRQKVADNPDSFRRGEIIPLPASYFANRIPTGPGIPARLTKRTHHMRSNQFWLMSAFRDRQLHLADEISAYLSIGDVAGIRVCESLPYEFSDANVVLFAQTKLRFLHDAMNDPMVIQAEWSNASAVVFATFGSFQGEQHTLHDSISPTVAPFLSQGAAAWQSECKEHWNVERQSLVRLVVEDFIHVCGDHRISEYRRNHATEFKKLQQRLPANLSKRLSRLGLKSRDLHGAARRTEELGLPPQNVLTINKKLGIMRQCFAYLSTHYDDVGNPFTGLSIRDKRSVRSAREPFSTNELNQLFASSLITEDIYWIAVISLFTGFRLGEICQINREDVRPHDEGFIYFTLPETARLKNPQSQRSIPVHQRLDDLGIREFICRRSGILFPRFYMEEDERKAYKASKELAAFYKKIEIKRSKISTHSFRHNWEAACNAYGVGGDDGYAKCRLSGEMPPGRRSRYGADWNTERLDTAFLVRLNSELQKIQYPDVKLAPWCY